MGSRENPQFWLRPRRGSRLVFELTLENRGTPSQALRSHLPSPPTLLSLAMAQSWGIRTNGQDFEWITAWKQVCGGEEDALLTGPRLKPGQYQERRESGKGQDRVRKVWKATDFRDGGLLGAMHRRAHQHLARLERCTTTREG
jgi:hypothetical protein